MNFDNAPKTTIAYNLVMMIAADDAYTRSDYFKKNVLSGDVTELTRRETDENLIFITDNVNRQTSDFALNEVFSIVPARIGAPTIRL